MTSYPLAQYSWDDKDVITISSCDSQLIGTFPMDFLRRSGVGIWDYILDVIRQLLDDERGGYLKMSNGKALDSVEPLEPGDYCYVSNSEVSRQCTWGLWTDIPRRTD